MDAIPIAKVLESIREQLGDASFIGRHGGVVDTDDHTGSRWYTDPEDPEVFYQSVTWTISSSESAPWLMAWAAKLAAEYAVDHWSEVGGLMRDVGPMGVVAWLKEEARRQRELAAECGTWHHDVLEAILLDQAIPDPPKWVIGRRLTTGGEDFLITQETLDRWADGILHFITDYRLVPVMSEATVCNPIEGYAARVDLGAEFPGHGLGLVDMKSGRPRVSVMAQLTAQKNATEVWLPLGGRVEMPAFEWGAVLHLRQTWERGYKLRRVPTGPAQWAWFRSANRLLKSREEQPDLERMALYPPEFDEAGDVVRIPTIPMLEDSGLRCAKPLIGAGLRWLHEVAEFTAEDLLSKPGTKTRPARGVKGVGPKSIEELRLALAQHGLTLAGEQVGEVA
jgi:hypothetical protein